MFSRNREHNKNPLVKNYRDLPPSEWPQFVSMTAIPGSTVTENGFPYVQWDVVTDWLEANIDPEQFNDAFHLLAYQWLEMLRASLDGNYEVHSSPNFYVLAEMGEREALDFLRFAETTRTNMMVSMGNIPEVDVGYGPHVAILFNNPDELARYIVRGMPEEGDFGMPAGVMADEGYAHIVMVKTPQFQMEPVFTHELSHALLAALPLPLWVNEGVTEIVTHELTGVQPRVVDADIMRKHRALWTSKTIQEFWSGGSFHRSGSLSEISYSLAMVLCKNLSTAYDCFPEFLRQADWADAGQSAAEDVFGITLGQIAAEFLGPGDWQPLPNEGNGLEDTIADNGEVP